MKVCIVVGTRPEIIKMSPIIRLCERNNYPYYIIHTGQHYSFSLDKVFFEELHLPTPEYNLEVGSASHAKQTALILSLIEDVFTNDRPSIVLVQGDTNSVMAAALAGCKEKIMIGHVEAGLRSYDRNMPEEINRIVADHVSDYLYAPTETAKKNLLNEGIDESKIIITGNTITDAVYEHIDIAKSSSSVMKDLNITTKNYFLGTFHRPENVDDKHKLRNILRALERIASDYQVPIIIPMHPRTKKMINEYHITIANDWVKILEPVSYLDFLLLQLNALTIITDSGGVQEEACILKVPCVTLRENTERPETVEKGANVISGTKEEKIVECVKRMVKTKREWDNPYGDGNAARIIMEHILSI
ncbi:MAG: UDP-N-acetylglucosamine 2-epimerase (non-hydrolyzing) [Syntrophales bacterium]|nr:UDP-N-acetylglucosamine 2-epimerase (non-hydrolyzing) [Syntrophales bacterium]MCK9528853.1 UDP-N-acetylglucosamine 2-epimerase (non-hydrolyzing) [Syntrophales bacterium]MDX9921053.1 UDP-N-acetylglucosamine 2-epimerase (non-hydrolyzing) [Syntrophales bacterium]